MLLPSIITGLRRDCRCLRSSGILHNEW